MIELQQIATLISIAKDLLPALGAAWEGQSEDDSVQQDIRELVQEQYEILRSSIGSSSMQMLAHLDGCSSCEPDLLIREVEPGVAKIQSSARKIVKREFRFRLAFLKALGVLSEAGLDEYRISHLGKNFVREARARKDYAEILLA